MNKRLIIRLLGSILLIEAMAMVPALVIALIYGDGDAPALLWSIGLLILCGSPMKYLSRPVYNDLRAREGILCVALSWVLLAVFGAFPFLFSGVIPNYVDAFFEAVSGFTTTGASIISNVDGLPRGVMFWRSFTHWIGGMGVLVFLLAIVPMSGGSHFNLMRAESPGPSVGKLVPKVKSTAQILYLIYLAMTVIQVIVLLLADMPVFDALTITFGTAGTGGFGIKADSMASYSPAIQWIVTIFMILFGVNFNAYYWLIFGKVKKAFGMEEVRWYFLIILVSIAIIFVDLLSRFGAFEALTHAAFQVGTIITTTGYATDDFNLWSSTSKTVLVLLMFIGACAGSTGGGIKVSRIVILFKAWVRELRSHIHPRSVRTVNFEGKPLEPDVLRTTLVYLSVYVFLFAGAVLLISTDGFDMTTNFTAVAATINNIGPGLEVVGPVGNFAAFSDFSTWVLILSMLAGRLELFPMLLLLHPKVWKEMFQRKS